MMLGEAGGIFEKADRAGSEAQRFHDHIRVQVAHLSPDALLRLLCPLIATANDLLCIRQFCSRHSGGQTASGLGTGALAGSAGAMALDIRRPFCCQISPFPAIWAKNGLPRAPSPVYTCILGSSGRSFV